MHTYMGWHGYACVYLHAATPARPAPPLVATAELVLLPMLMLVLVLMPMLVLVLMLMLMLMLALVLMVVVVVVVVEQLCLEWHRRGCVQSKGSDLPHLPPCHIRDTNSVSWSW